MLGVEVKQECTTREILGIEQEQQSNGGMQTAQRVERTIAPEHMAIWKSLYSQHQALAAFEIMAYMVTVPDAILSVVIKWLLGQATNEEVSRKGGGDLAERWATTVDMPDELWEKFAVTVAETLGGGFDKRSLTMSVLAEELGPEAQNINKVVSELVAKGKGKRTSEEKGKKSEAERATRPATKDATPNAQEDEESWEKVEAKRRGKGKADEPRKAIETARTTATKPESRKLTAEELRWMRGTVQTTAVKDTSATTATGSTSVIEQAARGRIITDEKVSALRTTAKGGTSKTAEKAETSKGTATRNPSVATVKGNATVMEQTARDRLRKSELHPETDESKTPRPPLTVAEKAGIEPWKKESRPTTAFEKAGIERMRKGSCTEINSGKKCEPETESTDEVRPRINKPQPVQVALKMTSVERSRSEGALGPSTSKVVEIGKPRKDDKGEAAGGTASSSSDNSGKGEKSAKGCSKDSGNRETPKAKTQGSSKNSQTRDSKTLESQNPENAEDIIRQTEKEDNERNEDQIRDLIRDAEEKGRKEQDAKGA